MTAAQPSLFDVPVLPALRPVVEVQHAPDESLDSRFRAWITANPQVLDAFIALALQLHRAGRQHYGAKAIIERLRWEYAVRTTGDDFRWNNNYTSRLARLAVAQRPELAPLFEFRELRS